MRSSTIGEWTLGACLVLLYPWLSGCSGGTDPGSGHEPFGEIESAYTDGTEPSPAEWICDLPMTVSWQVYAPGETEFHLNECLFRNDWDLNAACHNTTGRPCCLWSTHTHSVSYANDTWYCSGFAKGWRHL